VRLGLLALGGTVAALAAGLVAALPAGAPEPAKTGGSAPPAAPGRATSMAPLQEEGYPFTPWDGRFVFVRVYFDDAARSGDRGSGSGFGGRRGFSRGCGREDCWHHDYPYAETNLTALLNDITTLRGYVGGNVIRASDPQLHRFPLAWLAEPGHWTPSAAEVENVRSYLLKGGFMIFDDFGGPDLQHLIEQMGRILPELRPIQLDGSEPIFHSFFEIEPANLVLHGYRAQFVDETYYGYFEDNDRSKRQLAVLDQDNDIGEFIEYRETGFAPVDMTNEAYKLAVNYTVYALTH